MTKALHPNPDIKSILVFGAKDHLGSVVAQYIKKTAPSVKLRLATHKAENLPQLQALFPGEEVVVADLLDESSMKQALEGIEGIFQVSPDVFDEDTLVDNMLAAANHVGSIKHIVRILGTPPGARLDMVPEDIAKYRHYPATQHLVSRERYLQSGLPTTFVNVAGYFMDDFIRMFSPSIFNEKTIRVAFNKKLAWLAPVDVSEVCGQILLNGDHKTLGQTIDLTGCDLYGFDEVATLFSEVLETPIAYDDDEDRFFDTIQPVFSQLWGEEAPAYFVKYFKWETEHAGLFHINDNIEQILNRPSTSFRQWTMDNKGVFLEAWADRKVAAENELLSV